MSVITDEKKIDEVLTRGVERVYPNAGYLKKEMQSGRVLSLYFGIDPTGPTLHIGHTSTIRKLAEFQRLGHRVILLIGDFTATIGDPTDKGATRVKLSRDEVMENSKLYKEQAAHFLVFDGENPAEIKYNSEWLGKMNFADVLELASKFTHEQLIGRDMFQKRISEGKNLYMHELMYPLMQGYDSVAMDVDGEIGGNDQTFNMLAGRDLMKKEKGKEKFVLATKLIVDPTGKKIGKTEGNMVAWSDSPTDVFGKIMSWPDTVMPLAYELCTDITEPDLTNPMDAKLTLAQTVVGDYFGEAVGTEARRQFVNTFSKGEQPENVPEILLVGKNFVEELIAKGMAKSKSDYRRLLDEGAIHFNEEKISDPNWKPQSSGVLKIGKHRFVRILLR
jgi:tyrosyl-tRNA synthetase